MEFVGITFAFFTVLFVMATCVVVYVAVKELVGEEEDDETDRSNR